MCDSCSGLCLDLNMQCRRQFTNTWWHLCSCHVLHMLAHTGSTYNVFSVILFKTFLCLLFLICDNWQHELVVRPFVVAFLLCVQVKIHLEDKSKWLQLFNNPCYKEWIQLLPKLISIFKISNNYWQQSNTSVYCNIFWLCRDVLLHLVNTNKIEIFNKTTRIFENSKRIHIWHALNNRNVSEYWTRCCYDLRYAT